ncbi:MAG: lasso peptide biosynthesis B2 protein [Acidobacteriota bacterium]|nr:lasso peptide biosynthesis B2 protein [Acidobacteriota bacterium]
MPLVAKLARRRPAEWLLAAEALVLLSLFHVALRLIPVHRVITTLCRGRGSDPLQAGAPIDARAREVSLRVRWAVESVSRNAPARFVCFPQALAGYAMLRRRGVPSTIVYGVARSAAGALIAHTWLTVGDRTVLGGDGSSAFRAMEWWS